jgi:hypothetical protein
MRLRFTIRDLLWLTLVVALAVGWWIDHRRLTDFIMYLNEPPPPLQSPPPSPMQAPILRGTDHV